MQHTWTINSEVCYSYYCLFFLKIQFNGTYKKNTEPGNQRNSRHFLLMNIVSLFLILEKKNQEFAFNVQSNNSALPTALCCTPLGGCRTGCELFAVFLNKIWAWEAILTTPSDERFGLQCEIWLFHLKLKSLYILWGHVSEFRMFLCKKAFEHRYVTKYMWSL